MKIEVTPAGNEITVRKGEALPAKAAKSITIDGTLQAPHQFLIGRGSIETGNSKSNLINDLDSKNIHLQIFKDLGKLVLYIGDTDPHTTHVITGKLKRDSVLEMFGINTEKRWTVKQLVTFFRMMKFYFNDPEKCNSLVESLNKWTAKIERVIKEHNDNSGNSNMSLETKVSDVELLRSFELNIPIYQGYEKQKFKVEIGLDPRATSVDLFLLSDELIELEATFRESIMEKELKNFNDYSFSKVVVS